MSRITRLTRRNVLTAGATLALSPAMLALCGSGARAADDPYAGAKLLDGEPPKPKKESFTVAVLPDTQKYSDRHPEVFAAQTAWLAESRKDRNLACVLHLGDITDNNTPREWENAARAMAALDDKLPYFVVPGNHDYSEGGVCKDRTTRLNDYFPLARFQSQPTFGGVYDKEPTRLENSYHTFSAGGRDFLVLALEFGPRRDVVRWANEVAARHADRAAILITHAFMYYDDTRYDWKKYGEKQRWNPHNYPVAKATDDDVTDGQELWDTLVSRHHNFVLTLNGHVLGDGLGRTRTTTPAGRDVHQVLVNFQMKPRGGDGWLRLLEFQPDGQHVQTYDYSPTRNQRNASPDNQFLMKLAAVGSTS